MDLKLSEDGTYYRRPDLSPARVKHLRAITEGSMQEAKLLARQEVSEGFTQALKERLRMIMKKDRTLEWRETERDRIIMSLLIYTKL